MSKRYFSLLVTMLVAVVIFATPVFAAEFEEPENLSEELVLCDSDVVEEVSEEQVDILGSEESTPAEESVVGESVEENVLVPLENHTFSASNEEAGLGKVETYYSQPRFKVKDGYDVIMFYVSSETSGATKSGLYDGKAYFIVDKSKSEENWMLYNFKEETAKQYLVGASAGSDGLVLPVIESQSRTDDSSTMLIDESRVPLMTKEAFYGIYCNWRNFSDIPFIKASDGSLMYAVYSASYDDDDTDDAEEEEDKVKEDIPSYNSNTEDWYRYTVNLKNGNKNTYRIFVTREVYYDGRRHVLKGSRSGKNKTNDIAVHVYLNGKYVSPDLYTVQFKNNKNCNGYGGDKDNVPYFKLKFKFKNKALKSDIRAFERKGFGFDILPLDISEGVISYKSIKNGQLKKAVWTNENVSISLNPPKGTQGDYYLKGSTIYGKNNFYGKTIITGADFGDSDIY